MPEENQKRWTKLVKRQSRATWAVLGVALIALLLAVWWVPALASGPGLSLSPNGDDNGDGNDGYENNNYPGYVEIQTESDSGVSIKEFFAIEVSCDENFQVKSIYAKAADPDNDEDFEIRYFKVFVREDFNGFQSWDVAHDDFEPGTGLDSLQGYELLSQMELENVPLGVPAYFTFRIGGEVVSSEDESDDTLSITAVLESNGSCWADIISDD